MASKFSDMTSSLNFLDVLFQCSKFPVNIITGSAIMRISFYKVLTRNPEIGNNPSEFCLISGDCTK